MGVKCGNQMFLDWLTEIREDAQAKGLKTAEAYGKGCKSLAACPVTYERPRDLICLTGIGPKTVALLEKRWRAWCMETGRPIDATPDKRKKPRQPSTSPLPDGISDISDLDAPGPSSRPGPSADATSTTADSTSQTKSKGKAKARAPAKPKSYVPQARSGAYAILLALVLAIDNPLACTQVYMGKSELSRAAQPFSDSSFSASEKGGYYTAWNSMKTLVMKGMVYASGNPQRYCLTEEGYDTACAIRALLPEYAHLPRHPFLHDTVPVSIAQTAALARAASNNATAGPSRLPMTSRAYSSSAMPSPPLSKGFEFDFDLSRSPSPPLHLAKAKIPRLSSSSSIPTAGPNVTPRQNRFQFWYISSLGTRVPTLSEAMIRLDPDEFVNLRKVEFRFHQRDHPFVKQQVRLVDGIGESSVRDESGMATLMGYVLEEGAPPKCSKFDDAAPRNGNGVPELAPQKLGPAKARIGETGRESIIPKKRPSLLDDDGPLYGTSTSLKGSTLVDDGFDFGLGAFDENGDEDDDFLPMQSTAPIKRARAPMTARKEIGGSSFTFARTTSAPTGSASLKARPGFTDVASDLDILDKPALKSASRKVGTAITTASMSSIETGSSRSRPAAVPPVLPRGPRLSSHVIPSNPLEAHYPGSMLASGPRPASTDALAVADAGPENGSSSTPTFHPSNAIIFPPGSYDIILILDTREIESKQSRDRFAESLAQKGIQVETRALRLGDMMWIARYRDGMGGEEDECVLDYVVERKRLDDLCNSIRDGRYTEQCHRLGNSGIRNVYYIVEDFQVAERMEYNGLQIQTAKSQIQVHNQFFLKETHKLAETVDFLCTMTRVIQGILKDKELRVIPTKYLSRPTYKALQDRLRAGDASTGGSAKMQGNNDNGGGGGYLTSFEAYQALNDKSASSTLKDKFARMLMCVKGMSAEKVASVLDVWDTPRAMWDDLKAHEKKYKAEAKVRAAAAVAQETELAAAEAAGKKGKGKGKKEVVRAKEMFFADTVKGEGRRKIGDALSRELYRCLMGDDE